MKFPNSIFWNGLDYKNIKYKFLLFIFFIEVGVDISMWDSLSWRERIVFFGILEIFLSQCGYNWCKNLESQNFLTRTFRKWPFAFQVYTKKIQELVYLLYLRNSRSSKISRISQEFKNWFICIISEHSEKYFYRKLF